MGICDEGHLTTAGLVKIVVEGEEKNGEEEKRQEAKLILLSVISLEEIEKIMHCTSAHQIWAHFTNTCGQKTSNLKLELMDKLDSSKASSARGVATTINKITALQGTGESGSPTSSRLVRQDC